MIARFRNFHGLLVFSVCGIIAMVYILFTFHPSSLCTSPEGCGVRGHIRPAGHYQPSLRQLEGSVLNVAKYGAGSKTGSIGPNERKADDIKKKRKSKEENLGLLLESVTDEADTEDYVDIELEDNADKLMQESYMELQELASQGTKVGLGWKKKKQGKIGRKENDIQRKQEDGKESRNSAIRDPLSFAADPVEHQQQADLTPSNLQKQQKPVTNDLHWNSLLDVDQSTTTTTDSIDEGDVHEGGRVVRECVTGDVLGEVDDTAPLELLPLDPLDPSATEEPPRDRQRSFQRVFDTRAWGHGWDQNNKGLNASGMGSTLLWSQEMIATLHRTVDEIKRQLGVARVTVLDVPCGDLVWMHRFLQTRDDIMYTGMDIVPDIIKHHQREYPVAEYPQRRFIHADVVTLKKLGSYHIVLSRMLMQHLQHFDIYQLLLKISTSGSHYALLTTLNSRKNRELSVHNPDNPGRFRPVNLELPPYQLEPPICLERDGPPNAYMAWDHFVGLWKLPLKVHAKCEGALNRWKHTEHQLYSCTRWKDPL